VTQQWRCSEELVLSVERHDIRTVAEATFGGEKRKRKEEINLAKAEVGKQSSSIVFAIIAWCYNRRGGGT